MDAYDFKFYAAIGQGPVPMDRPPGVVRKIMSWKDGQSGGRSCLFYKSAAGEKGGRLFLQYHPGECEWSLKEAEIVFSEKILDLSLALNKGVLELSYIQNEKRFGKKWLLYNLNQNNFKMRGEKETDKNFRNGPWGRYSSGAPKRLIPGVFFVPSNFSSMALMGKKNDRYIDRNAILCHGFDENCKEVKKFECERCRYGWYEVSGYNCPQGRRKYCGRNLCGQRGAPACVRGESVLTMELRSKRGLDFCRMGQGAVYCQVGLVAQCDLNGILICK